MNVDDFLACGALICIPQDRLLIGWGPRHWSDKLIDGKTPSFYFPDFFLENPNAWFQHSHWKEMAKSDLLRLLGNKPEIPSIDWKVGDKDFFFNTFRDLQQQFVSEKLLKAVPFSFTSSQTSMTPRVLHHALIHLLNYIENTPLNPYGFWDSQGGILGATPELLCSLKGNQKKHLSTVALAGTFSKEHGPIRLFENPKELHEHQLVVEGIRKSLHPFGQITVGSPSVIELPTLYHIMTPIEATLHPDIQLDNIVKALHPTPALGAFPRKTGLHWLKSIQSLINRHRFGAPAGVCYQNQELSHFWVAIRNVQWDCHHMFIGAGCGVTPASQPDKEWNEILLKTRSTQQMLGL